jgi:hypothetical protein
MYMDKDRNSNIGFGVFEVMILAVGVALTMFGFIMLSRLYKADGAVTWAMMQTVFLWLVLLVLFMLLSVGVDANRRQLQEIKLLKEIIKDELAGTRLMKEEIEIMNKRKDSSSMKSSGKSSRSSTRKTKKK